MEDVTSHIFNKLLPKYVHQINLAYAHSINLISSIKTIGHFKLFN